MFLLNISIAKHIGFPKTEILNKQKLIAQQSKTLYFGVKNGIPPIGDTSILNFEGYCADILKELQIYMNKQNPNLKIDWKIIPYKQRFKGQTEQGESLAGECGADTIKEGRFDEEIDGVFSIPFAYTGSKILIRDDKVKYLYQKIPFECRIIGLFKPSKNENDKVEYSVEKIPSKCKQNILDNENFKKSRNNIQCGKLENLEITTSDLIPNVFPQACFKLIYERGDAINQLEEEIIDAYITDEILLKETLKLFRKKLREGTIKTKHKYQILPKMGKLSHEQYGIVIYKNKHNPEIISVTNINTFLATDEAKKIAQRYFGKRLLSIDNLLTTFYNFSYRHIGKLLTIFLILLLLTMPFFTFVFFKLSSTKFLRKMIIFKEKRLKYFEEKEYRVAIFILTIVFNKYTYGIMSMANKEIKTEFYSWQEQGGQINNLSTAEPESKPQFIQNNFPSDQKQSLAEAAAEIQKLLKQLKESNPTATVQQQQDYVNISVSQGNQIKFVNALQAGWEKALEEFLDNSYLQVAIAILKGWNRDK